MIDALRSTNNKDNKKRGYTSKSTTKKELFNVSSKDVTQQNKQTDSCLKNFIDSFNQNPQTTKVKKHNFFSTLRTTSNDCLDDNLIKKTNSLEKLSDDKLVENKDENKDDNFVENKEEDKDNKNNIEPKELDGNEIKTNNSDHFQWEFEINYHPNYVINNLSKFYHKNNIIIKDQGLGVYELTKDKIKIQQKVVDQGLRSPKKLVFKYIKGQDCKVYEIIEKIKFEIDLLEAEKKEKKLNKINNKDI